MENDKKEALQAFGRLLTIMDELREKCPWDRKQTMETLRHLTIEELYELSDSILEQNPEEIRKELGDIMLHLVFYTKIASEKGWFDVHDMLNEICEKLISRHPHIYSDVTVTDELEVKQNWEQLKLKEGNRSVLQGVPSSLPALVKAARIQEKVAGVGFDWANKEQVWEKVQEEMNEFAAEKDRADTEPEAALKMEEEFGDLLFSLINYARFLNISPENALEKTNRKFIKRFAFIEERARQEGLVLKPGMLEKMDEWWNEAKAASL